MAIGEQAVGTGPDELLSISALEGRNGLEIIDHIERRHFSIETPDPVEAGECSTDIFEFPVERAVSIETDRIELPNQLGVIIRNSLGFMVAEVSTGETQHFPRDGYSLDPGAPIKTYVDFECGFSVDVTNEGTRVELDTNAEVHLGFRSHHKQPAATITTPDRISDLMAAMSYFGSALKTTSCERSYPSLRGHPPLLEVGSELEVPAVLSKPETGIRIEIPPDRDHVFTVASLAYYLGADVVPGEEPRIVTERGFVHELDTGTRRFDEEVDRVLKQVFFLDCVTRTEGFFQVDLHERNQVEDRVGLDFEALYQQPIADQLAQYLDLGYDLIRTEIPKWKLTAHVSPSAEYVPALPFLANDLARIRPANSDSGRRSRQSDVGDDRAREGGQFARNAVESAPRPPTVRIEDDDSMEQAWLGEGAPLGASKAMVEAFHNQIGRKPSDEDIDITVVCNASEMGEEGTLVNEVYGTRDELPFDVSIYNELTVRELRTVIEGETDFLHYIGHIDAGGFECADGRLDVSTMDSTGVESFFLNACTSYEQGRALIRAGSIAGVVTLEDVINSGAQRVGKTLARLLNCGFPLRPALDIAKNESIMGGHYVVLGDGSVDIAQPEYGFPVLIDINSNGVRDEMNIFTYPSQDRGLGNIFIPSISNDSEHYLSPNKIGPFFIEDEEMTEYIALGKSPYMINGKLRWVNKDGSIGLNVE